MGYRMCTGHGTTFRAVERPWFEQGALAMPTHPDMTHLLDLLASEDDPASRIFVRAVVVAWAVACLALWGAS
jgi:hypothetical protein